MPRKFVICLCPSGWWGGGTGAPLPLVMWGLRLLPVAVPSTRLLGSLPLSLWMGKARHGGPFTGAFLPGRGWMCAHPRAQCLAQAKSTRGFEVASSCALCEKRCALGLSRIGPCRRHLLSINQEELGPSALLASNTEIVSCHAILS